MSLYLLLLLDVFIAYTIEVLIGYPRGLPHPERFIRWLIRSLERVMRFTIRVSSEKKVKALGDDVVRNTRKIYRNEKIAGGILAVLVISIAISIVFTALKLCMFVNPILFHVVNIVFIYTSFASRKVSTDAFSVFDALKEREVFNARKMLNSIVGNETDNLDEKEIIKGTVEITAKNIAGRVVAPIFYALLGTLMGVGAPMVYAYIAIDALDSILGHKDREYKNMGYISAKLDDVANFIPARLSGFIVVLGAMVSGKDFKRAYSVMMRDRKKHNSPNFGYPEAAMAGALGIRLGGVGLYFGDILDKPVIGDDINPLEIRVITQSVTMMYIVSIIAMIILSALAILIFVLMGFIVQYYVP